MRVFQVCFYLLLVLERISAQIPETRERQHCWSTLEQRLFWKASNYTQSSAFKRLLRTYQKFHAECRHQELGLDSQQLYAELNGEGEGKLTCQYVIWFPPYDGLGNKLVSLVSAFLYALLSKRVFVMDPRLDLGKLLCNPFSNSSWMLPAGVRTDLLQQSSVPFNSWAESATEEKERTHSVLVNVNHEQNIMFFCPSELSRLQKVPLLLLESNMYFVPGFYYTKYRKRMERLFPDRIIFTAVGRRILNPSNKIWERITGFYHQNLKPAKVRLGLQLRTRDAPWRIEKSQRLDRCIQREKLLPHRAMFRKDAETSPGNKGVEVAAFVATLKGEFVSRLEARYSRRPLKTGKKVQFFRASSQVEQDSSNLAQSEDAMVDMWLLSFTDNLLISHTSTFGYIASSLQGKPPIMINHAFMTEDEDRRLDVADCDLTVTPEPCYHNPPFQVQCPRDPPFTDPWNQDEAVRRCVDWIRGVQVIPRQKP